MDVEETKEQQSECFLNIRQFDKETPNQLRLLSTALYMLDMTKGFSVKKQGGILFDLVGSRTFPVLNVMSQTLSVETRGLVRLIAHEKQDRPYAYLSFMGAIREVLQCHMFLIDNVWFPVCAIYEYDSLNLNQGEKRISYRKFDFVFSPDIKYFDQFYGLNLSVKEDTTDPEKIFSSFRGPSRVFHSLD